MARGSSSASPAKSTSSGRETHAPNRFEATREKDPSRVEGGKKAAQTRGQQVHEDDDEPLDQEDIPDSNRHGNDLLGNDFHAGKNPNRQESSKRVAKERGHDAFVEMGKKGGSTQKGIHAGQINGLDADDMTTYLEHPEVGVPEKNPNRVNGGKKAAQTRGQDVHDMPEGGLNTRGSGKKQEQKDPVRVEAGKKAARTRGLHVKDDDSNDDNEDDEDDDEEEDSDDNHNKNQRGSAQKSKQQNKNYNSTQQKNNQGKNPNRVAGGKQAAKTRGDNVHDDDDDDDDSNDDDNSSSYNSSRSHHDGDYSGKNPNRVEGGKRAASQRSHEDFVEMGRKGGSASKSGRKSQQHDDDDDSESNEHNDRQQGKNPNRVRGGKQAAKTRGDNVNDDEDDSNDDSESNNNNNNNNNNKNNNRSHHDGDYNGKNPNRVEGGKRAAAHRSHEDFSEMGKKGAEARIQKHGEQRHNSSGSASKNGRKSQQHDDDDDDDEDDEDENDSVSKHQNDRQNGKNPNRVAGGKQAAKTRGDNVHDEGESSSSSSRRRSNSNNNRSKSMKDSDDEDADYDDSRASRESVYSHAGFGLDKAGVRDDGKSARRVVGGQSAALQRGFNVKKGEEETDNGNPNRIQGGLEAASKRSHEDFVEMGKKGGRTQKKQNNDDDMEDEEDHSSSSAKKNSQGKNPNRVAGGKQAAKTRGDNVHDDNDNSDDNSGPSSGTRSHHDDDYNGKNPNRVEGGKKAASHRSHEEMSEIGKKGASARWGKDYTEHSDEKHEYDSGEQSSKSTGNYRSKREADTNIHSPSKRQRQTSAY